ARKIAEEKNLSYLIVDGSPGIGCPVIASITGVDLALIVVEPTLSGIHDLERVLDVTIHFGVKALVCINKSDLNERITNKIEKFCKENDILLAGKIPYDTIVPQSIIAYKSILEMPENSVANEIKEIWKIITETLSKE
ncbi:MAG: (4Fe-4S)-binding protein, partial [Candidatus Heimdallarchaeota archaeon]